MNIIIVNRRAGWATSGMFITRFAKDTPVDPQCMASYYGLNPGDKHYDELQRPNKHMRVVLMKPNARFVIVPITPETIEMPS